MAILGAGMLDCPSLPARFGDKVYEPLDLGLESGLDLSSQRLMRMHSQGVSARSPPSPPSAFVPISDKDMTEIELYSVDSINDLHRTHPEQHSKGFRPPRPRPPSINGNLQMIDRPVVCPTGSRTRGSHLSPLGDKWTSLKWRYSLTCLAVVLMLLTVILIFGFLVQQSRTLHRLAESLKQKQETTDKISTMFQELQALCRNLTALKIRH